jgi:hypothetical protein
MAGKLKEISGPALDLVYRLERDTYNGRARIRLNLADIRRTK